MSAPQRLQSRQLKRTEFR